MKASEFCQIQAIEWFDVADVVRAPARLDWDKLNFINGQYIRAADDARLAGLVLGDLRRQDRPVPTDAEARLARTIPLVKEGAKTIPALADLTDFALKARPVPLSDKTVGLLTEETRARLGRLRQRLASAGDWSLPALEAQLREFAEAEGVGLGKFGPALRGVLSGGATAPDLASALAALGQDESLGRLDDALSQAA